MQAHRVRPHRAPGRGAASPDIAAISERIQALLDEVAVDQVGRVTFLLRLRSARELSGWRRSVGWFAALFGEAGAAGTPQHIGDTQLMRNSIRRASHSPSCRGTSCAAPWCRRRLADGVRIGARQRPRHDRARRPPAAPRRRPGRPPGPSQAAHLCPADRRGRRLYAAGGYAHIQFATIARRSGLTEADRVSLLPQVALLRAIFDTFGERLERAAETRRSAPSSRAARLEQLIASLVEFYGRIRSTPAALSSAPRGRALRRLESGDTALHRLRPLRAPLRCLRRLRHRGRRVLPGVRSQRSWRWSGRPVEFSTDHGRRYRAGAAGRVSLAERGREMAALITRAVIRRSLAGARTAPFRGADGNIDADGHVVEPAEFWARELRRRCAGAASPYAGTPTRARKKCTWTGGCCCRTGSSASAWRAGHSTTSARGCATPN